MESINSLRYRISSPDRQYMSLSHSMTPRSSADIKTPNSYEAHLNSPFNYNRRVDIQVDNWNDPFSNLNSKHETFNSNFNFNSKSQRLISFARNSPKHSKYMPEIENESLKLKEELNSLKASNWEYKNENTELILQVKSLRSNIREYKNYIDYLENTVDHLRIKAPGNYTGIPRNRYNNPYEHSSLYTNQKLSHSYMKNPHQGFTIQKFETGINPHKSKLVHKMFAKFKVNLADMRDYVKDLKETYSESYKVASKELILADSNIKQLRQENKRLQDSNHQLNKSIDFLSSKIDALKNDSSVLQLLDSSKLYEKLAQELKLHISTHLVNPNVQVQAQESHSILPRRSKEVQNKKQESPSKQVEKVQALELREQNLLRDHLKTLATLQFVCQNSKKTEKKLELLLSAKGDYIKDIEDEASFHPDSTEQHDYKLQLFPVESD